MKIRDVVIIGVLVLAFLAVPVEGYTFNNFFYLVNHGTDCITELPNNHVNSVLTEGWGHTTVLNKAPVSAVPAMAYTHALIDCPVPTMASYTGRHPLIRYAMIEYATQSRKSQITQVDFYNGRSLVKSIEMKYPYYSDPDGNTMEMNLDLGSWYDFWKGMNQVISIRNIDTTSSQWVLISGYGARGDYQQ